jgi:BirA family biotin operon repressor/biotin-[acetyl-CoA-carboxylase] ligase
MGPVNTSRQDSLAHAVRAAGIDVPPIWHDEVASTNDEAIRLATAGAPEWTVVAAGHQTAGRGRLGRSWADVPGKALLCSVLLRPKRPPEEGPALGLLAATAMIAAADVSGLRSKWPNDLVLGGRKVGGILTEARVERRRLSFVVVGVGVNLGTGEDDVPISLRSTAAALSTGPETLLSAFLEAMRRGSGGSVDEIVDDYRTLCATLGSRVRATTTSGEIVEGTAVDLDERGRLVVDVAGTHRIVSFGEIHHLG